jgi:hypothetical protein
MRGSLGKVKKTKRMNRFDLQIMQNEDGGSMMDIETQRSAMIENEYERIVLQQEAKQVEIDRYHEHEYVPPIDDIMQEKHLKIVVKMSNFKF